MRIEPGFVSTLKEQLTSLPDDLISRIDRVGRLTRDTLIGLVSQPQGQDAIHIDQPSEKDFVTYDEHVGSVGAQAIKDGHVIHCILAGGIGTRLGKSKALLKFSNNLSLLGMRLCRPDVRNILMLSHQHKEAVIDILNDVSLPREVGAFEQFECVRLTVNNEVSYNNGKPETYPTGTGDMPSALLDSGVTAVLKEAGIRYVVVSNVDNILSGPDPIVIGRHIESQNPVTVEVVNSDQQSDSSVVWANGRLRAIDDFGDGAWHNTNNYVINVDALEDAASRSWRWNRVRKIENNRIVVQYERSLCQLTEFYESTFVHVPLNRCVSIQSQQDVLDIEGKLFSEW